MRRDAADFRQGLLRAVASGELDVELASAMMTGNWEEAVDMAKKEEEAEENKENKAEENMAQEADEATEEEKARKS